MNYRYTVSTGLINNKTYELEYWGETEWAGTLNMVPLFMDNYTGLLASICRWEGLLGVF